MAAKHPGALISIAAIQSQQRSYVFYSEPNGNLSYLKSRTEEEYQTSPLYETEQIKVKNRVVTANTKSPQIAAVSYSLDGRDEIRVYYISDQGFLQELCRTNGGEWTAGSLNDTDDKASPGSLLTVSVDYTNKGQLKLYYYRENESALRCTWVALGQLSWSTKKIN